MKVDYRTETILGPAAFERPNRDLYAALDRNGPFARAYIGGTFDLPHVGHFALLAKARRLAKEVVVAVNTDEFAEQYKSTRPFMPLEHRLAVMQNCRLVDRVMVNTGGADSKPTILASEADVIVHGSDWIGGSLMLQMGIDPAWLAVHGIRLVIVPYTKHVSSSLLRNAARGNA